MMQSQHQQNQTPLMEKGRLRNQSLTYGVSEADLQRAARTVMNEPQNPPPFSLQMPVRKEQRGKFNSTRHSLPDLFEGLNQPPAFLAQHNPHIQQMQSETASHVSASHVSSSSCSSQQVKFQSPVVVPPTPVSVSIPASLSSSSLSSRQYQDNAKAQESRVYQDSVSKEDEAMKMLQRHYLQAILTLAPPHKLSEASTTIKNQAQAQALAAKEESLGAAPPPPSTTTTSTTSTAAQELEELSSSIASVNPPPKILDNILKLWEESQAENQRLRQDMMTMRQELEATKQQLESAFQANSSVSDAEKEDRKAMEKKLDEMEEKVKNLTASPAPDVETEMTVTKLKEDNIRLREENAGLIKVMSKLSENKK